MKNLGAKGVLFDFDGVIFETDIYHYLAWNAIADEFGIDFDEKINNQLRGISREESLNIILENGNVSLCSESKKELLEKKNKLYIDMVSKIYDDQIKDTVFEVVSKQHEKNIKVAIALTSKNVKNIEKILHILE